MAYGNCKNCNAGISWDEQKRKQLNTRRPLNYDGTIHTCGGNGSHHIVQQKPTPNPPARPAWAVNQEQKSKDIKDAQEERKVQHDQLITAMQNLTNAIIADIASRKGDEANDIVDSMAYDQSREDQRDFQDEVV